MHLFVSGTGQGISDQPVPKAPVVLLAAWDSTSRKQQEERGGHGGSQLYLAFKRLKQEVGGQPGLHRRYFFTVLRAEKFKLQVIDFNDQWT